jgi:hypothetical protein
MQVLKSIFLWFHIVPDGQQYLDVAPINDLSPTIEQPSSDKESPAVISMGRGTVTQVSSQRAIHVLSAEYMLEENLVKKLICRPK